MRSMIPPFAPHAAFCPIPSVNSKMPVRQQAKSQGMGPEGISRVLSQGLAQRGRQGILPWTVARDGRFCHFGMCGPSLVHHHAEAQVDPWKASTYESLWDSQCMAYGMAGPISKRVWRYTIGDTFDFGSFWVTKMNLFWDLNLTHSCGQLAAPYLYAYG